MGLFSEIRARKRAEKKMKRYEKAKQLEEEIKRVRREYPNLSYDEAVAVAKKNLKKRGRKKRSVKETGKRLLRILGQAVKGYRRSYSSRYRRSSRNRR
ncbi:hypothetical protein DRP04_12355 [Archaeoglobales archaeon]|nr:MAG: hypothetical protein DRP04_12355 [Archaeoglobales archaeon]